jgi:hypothetical protein
VSEIDPRKWKKEHQVAFIGAILIGAFIGICWQVGSSHWGIYDWEHQQYLTRLFGKIFVLSSLGGAVVYVVQLLRS